MFYEAEFYSEGGVVDGCVGVRGVARCREAESAIITMSRASVLPVRKNASNIVIYVLCKNV